MYLQAMNQGLAAAINSYASTALSLAVASPSDVSINNTYVTFIALLSPAEIQEGIEILADYLMAGVENVNNRMMLTEVGPRSCSLFQ